MHADGEDRVNVFVCVSERESLDRHHYSTISTIFQRKNYITMR